MNLKDFGERVTVLKDDSGRPTFITGEKGHMFISYAPPPPSEHGPGVVQDDGRKKIAALYYENAELGHATAQNNLGYCYENGLGVEKDFIAASNWYRKAANQGYSLAQYNMGRCYYYGGGVEKNLEKAAEWFLKAIEQGHLGAQTMLGDCYDGEEAFKLHLNAAERGNVRAMVSLGFCYESGDGVPENQVEALRWYLRAAEQNPDYDDGFADEAKHRLAESYEFGRGLPQNDEEAEKWYSYWEKSIRVPKSEVETVKRHLRISEQDHNVNIRTRGKLKISHMSKKNKAELKYEAVNSIGKLLPRLSELKPFIGYRTQRSSEIDDLIDEMNEIIREHELIQERENEVRNLLNNLETRHQANQVARKNFDLDLSIIAKQRDELKDSTGYKLSKLLQKTIGYKAASIDSYEKLDREINIFQDNANKIYGPHFIWQSTEKYNFEGNLLTYEELKNLSYQLSKDEIRLRKELEELQCEIYPILRSAAQKKEAFDKERDTEAKIIGRLGRRNAPSADVIRQLDISQPLNSYCPYCQNTLTNDRHIDHIIPVTKGGQTHFKNLTYVCSTCNLQKYNLTLNQYIDKYGLDRDKIFARLKALGKDY